MTPSSTKAAAAMVSRAEQRAGPGFRWDLDGPAPPGAGHCRRSRPSVLVTFLHDARLVRGHHHPIELREGGLEAHPH